MSISPNSVNQNLFHDLLQKNSLNPPVNSQVPTPAETPIKDTLALSSKQDSENETKKSGYGKLVAIGGAILALACGAVYLWKRHKAPETVKKVADSAIDNVEQKADSIERKLEESIEIAPKDILKETFHNVEIKADIPDIKKHIPTPEDIKEYEEHLIKKRWLEKPLNEDLSCTDLTKLEELAIKEYISGVTTNSDLRKGKQSVHCSILLSALQKIPRYAPEVDENGISKGLARWITIFDENYRPMNQTELADYVEKNFPINGKFKDKKFLKGFSSWSKDLRYAENEFHDENPEMNVKFIIRPRNRITLGRNIRGKHGNNEVLYPPNMNPNIVSKRLEHITSSKGEKFTRWIIELEEAEI